MGSSLTARTWWSLHLFRKSSCTSGAQRIYDMSMRVRHIRFSDEDWELLGVQARQFRITRSSLVRQIVMRWVSRQNQKETKEEANG